MCVERSFDYAPGMSYVTCAVNDKPCIEITQPNCAANGQVGYCGQNPDIQQLLCSDASDVKRCMDTQALYCTASEVSCYNEYTGYPVAEGSACNQYGSAGVCKSSKSTCYDQYGASIACPVLTGNATYLTVSELEAYCAPMLGAGCSAFANYCLVPGAGYSSILECQLSAVQVSYSSTVRCTLSPTRCAKVGDACIENGAFGVCQQSSTASGKLECYDRSGTFARTTFVFPTRR
jgi:hypothetical protein